MKTELNGLISLTRAIPADATLASLAYINITWEESNKSYLDNFLPLVIETLRLSAMPVSAQDLTTSVRTRFGLDLPVAVVTALLKRAVRTKQARRVKTDFVLDPRVADSLPDVEDIQSACRRDQRRLADGLAKFASELTGGKWNRADAESALMAYVDAHVVPLLALSTHRSTQVPEQASVQGQGYVVAAYIAKINETDQERYQALGQMIKGAMLASVLYVDKVASVSRKFDRTTLYLDTPVCLRALGHEGVDAQRAVHQMLSLALGQGAKLACFEHTVKEIRGVLVGARTALRSPRGRQTATWGVAAHFQSSSSTAADVDLAIQRLDTDLNNQLIQIRPAPPHAAGFGLDEVDLEGTIQQHINYLSDGTRLRDVDSLTAIHRLRRGASGPHLETCRAVFVTDNAGVVCAAREFFDSGRHEWPVAMLDHDLTTLVWVKNPKSFPDLPQAQVVADCYAAMSPTPAMWRRISEEIDRLRDKSDITPDDVTLLLSFHEAERAIMTVTTGDPNRVTQASLTEALDRAKAELTAPIEKTRDEAIQALGNAERAEAAQGTEAARAAEENQRLATRIKTLENKNRLRKDAICERVSRRMREVRKAVKLGALALLGLAAAATVISFLPASKGVLPTSVVWVCGSAAVLLALLGLFTSWSGSGIKDWIDKQAGRIETAWQQSALRNDGLLAEPADASETHGTSACGSARPTG